MATIGGTVRRLREELGLSQEELASLAGHSRNVIGSIESGKPARASTLRHIAKALGVTVADLRNPDLTPAKLSPIEDQPLPPGVIEDDHIRELRARIKMREADLERDRAELRRALESGP